MFAELYSRPLRAILSHFLGSYFVSLPTIDFVSLLSGQIELLNLRIKPDLLDGLASGIVERVCVSLNYANLSANVHISGSKLIFTRDAPSHSTSSDQLPPTTVHQQVGGSPESNELVDLLNKSFNLTFTIEDTTIAIHNTRITVPSISINESFIATADTARIFYSNALVAELLHVSYSHPRLTSTECILITDHIPHQLFKPEKQQGNGSSTKQESEPFTFSISIHHISAYITFATLEQTTKESFYTFRKNLDLQNLTLLPYPFSDESFLDTRRKSTSSHTLVADILAHRLGQSHVKVTLKNLEYSSEGHISIRHVAIHEWLTSSRQGVVASYTPILCFSRQPQTTSSFTYDYDAKDESQNDVTIFITPQKVRVEVSQCLVFADLESFERLSRTLSVDMDESVYYNANEDIRPTKIDTKISIEISAPFLRTFIKSPDYASITATSIYSTLPEWIILDFKNSSASIVGKTMKLKSEIACASLASFITQSDSRLSIARISHICSLYGSTITIDFSKGVEECTAFDASFTPTVPNQRGDWVMEEGTDSTSGFELGESNITIVDSVPASVSEEPTNVAFSGFFGLEGLRDLVDQCQGRAINVRIPKVVFGPIDKVVWVCVQRCICGLVWYGQNHVAIEHPPNMQDIPDVHDIPEIHDIPISGEDESDDSDDDDFQSAFGGSVYGIDQSTIFRNARVDLPALNGHAAIQRQQSSIDDRSFGDAAVVLSRWASLSLEVGQVDATLSVKDGESLVLSVGSVNLFMILQTIVMNSTTNIWIDAQTLTITATAPGRKSRTILHKTSPLKQGPCVSLAYTADLDTALNSKETSFDGYLFNITLSHTLDSSLHHDILAFVNASPIVYVDDVSVSTRILLRALDAKLAVKYSGGCGSFAVFESLVVSSDLLPDSGVGDVKVEVSKVIVAFAADHNSEYVEIMSCDGFDLLVRSGCSGVFEVVVTNQVMNVDTCADTFESLMDFLLSFGTRFVDYYVDGNQSPKAEKYVETLATDMPPPTIEVIDVFSDVDQEAFKTLESPVADGFTNFSDDSDQGHSDDDFFAVSAATSSMSASLQSRFAGKDEIITIHNPAFRLCPDFFDNVPSQSDGSSADIDVELIDLKVVLCDFNIVWRIFEGFDWKVNQEFAEAVRSSNRSKLGQHESSPEKGTGRSKEAKVELRAQMVNLEYAQFIPGSLMASRLLLTIRDFDVIDHVDTSSWRKFLSYSTPGNGERPREDGSCMVHIEYANVRPDLKFAEKLEARLKVRILPLSLRVDQDTLTCFIDFFSFSSRVDVEVSAAECTVAFTPFFQYVQVEKVILKIDYKPKHVDIHSLTNGNLLEFMNFAMLTDAQMSLSAVTLSGITGWDKVLDGLLKVWLPHLRLQASNVVSGVTGVSSLINIGGGIADLILMPLEQFRKDGRVIRGLQQGVTSFAKTTTIETIKFGTKIAAGTQVFLEQADEILSDGGRDSHRLPPSSSHQTSSKFAEQPKNISEGITLAFNSLRKNMTTAASTVLAIPTEIYEKDSHGTARAVIRAVPIAILKPMIGATEAITKTLIGVQNTLDPANRQKMDDKYK